MTPKLKHAFEEEMRRAGELYTRGDFDSAFAHFERAHILGQSFIRPHTLSHWWMLKIGLRRRDLREIVGQAARIAASLLFSRIWVPPGNTGGANVSPFRSMPIPDDLQALVDQGTESPRRFRPPGPGLVFLAGLVPVGALFFHHRDSARVEHDWQSRTVSKVSLPAMVTSLRILPLVNWHVRKDRPGLRVSAGVSYLLEIDGRRMLFDLGPGKNAPLKNNMRVLGIDPETIESVFLSHTHFDHLGGGPKLWGGLFSPEIPVHSPVPLAYRRLKITARPVKIGPGLASSGWIPRRLFMGRVREQALVINVKGKGLVLIVGCGHQTVERLLARTAEIFSDKLYGIVGDLHYPVPRGRIQPLGLNVQRIFASGKGPLRMLTRDDVSADIGLLRSRQPGLVALGGHDTSDEVIERFAREFGKAYKQVKVGEWINVQQASSPL